MCTAKRLTSLKLGLSEHQVFGTYKQLSNKYREYNCTQRTSSNIKYLVDAIKVIDIGVCRFVKSMT